MGGLLVPPFKLNSSTQIIPRSTAITSLVGNSSGLTIYGGSSGTATLTLQADSTTQNVGSTDRIKVVDQMDILSGSRTFTAAPANLLYVNDTYTLNFANALFNAMINMGGTIKLLQSAGTTMATTFNFGTTITNDSSVATGMSQAVALVAQQIFQADSQTITQSQQNSIMERASWKIANAGVFQAQAAWNQFTATAPGSTNVGSGVSMFIRNGYNADDVTGTGTLLANRGINVANQTLGRSSNYAIKTGTGIVQTNDDIVVFDNTKGYVTFDRGNGKKQRLFVTGDTISREEVTLTPWMDLTTSTASGTAGLYAFYRADAAYTGSVGNGNAITTWIDLGPSGFDATLGTGTAKPTWVSSDATLNSQPAVGFASASSQSLECTTSILGISPSLTAGNTLTICAVVDFATVNAAMRIFGHTTTSSRGFGITATPNWQTQMGGTAATGGTPATATKYFVRVIASSTAHTLFVNEVSTATTATAANGLNQIVLGAGRSNVPAYTNYFNGNIAEIMIYSGDATADSHYAHYKRYLNVRYGFALTVP